MIRQTLRPQYDAVVVGARAAGAATAMLLARAGLRVLAVDRGREGADTVSTHALMRAGVLQLHRWGLLDEVRAAGTPAVRRATFHYGDETLPVDVKPRDGVDGLYAPRRTVLDPILVEAARAAGARVEHQVAALELLADACGRVHGAVLERSDGRIERVEAPIVIGADGLRSRVAALARAPVERVARHATAVVYGYWSGLPLDGYHWYYRPGVSAGFIPTNDGEDLRLRRDDAGALPGGAAPGGGGALPLGARRGGAGAVGRRWGAPRSTESSTRSPARLGSCAASGAQGGRSSGTQGTSGIRSPRTASPTRSGTRSCWRAPSCAEVQRRSRSTRRSATARRRRSSS